MTKFIGIDIGHFAIKVAVLSQTKKGPYIESVDVYPLPTDPNSDREIATLEILQGIRERWIGQDCAFYFSIPQSKVAFRNKTFPFAERLKVLKALPFELEEDLPFALENSFWDARIVRQIGTDSEVLAAAVTQYQINKFMNSIGSLGLNIKKIIPQGNALHNAIAPINEVTWKLAARFTDESQEQKKSLKIVLDIGHTETTVNLYEDNIWINSSVILWGGLNLIKCLSQRYEIPIDESYKVIQEKGFVLIQIEKATYEQIVFSETLSSELKNLVKELTLVSLGFENGHHGTIEEILVTGGVSRLVHLGPFLTQQLEVPVNTLNYLDRWHYAPNIDIHLEPFISNAIGLALEGFRKNNQPQFQFLQGTFAVKNPFFTKFWNSAKDTVIWGSSIILLLWVWSSLRVSFTENLVTQIDDKIKEAGQVIADLPAKKSNAGQIKAFIKNSRNLVLERQLFEEVTQRASALDVLNWISDRFPDRTQANIQALELSIIDSTVKLKASTKSNSEKIQLIEALKNLSATKSIQDNGPANSSTLDIEFNLKNRDR